MKVLITQLLPRYTASDPTEVTRRTAVTGVTKIERYDTPVIGADEIVHVVWSDGSEWFRHVTHIEVWP